MISDATVVPIGRLLVSVTEAARILGVCRATVFREIRAKKLHPVKIGRRTLVSSNELARYVAALA